MRAILSTFYKRYINYTVGGENVLKLVNSHAFHYLSRHHISREYEQLLLDARYQRCEKTIILQMCNFCSHT